MSLALSEDFSFLKIRTKKNKNKNRQSSLMAQQVKATALSHDSLGSLPGLGTSECCRCVRKEGRKEGRERERKGRREEGRKRMVISIHLISQLFKR